MKKFVTNYIPYLLLAVMLIALIPSITNRISHEEGNKNVVISLLYNDIRNKLSTEHLDDTLEEYKKAGINTISIMEDDINSMVARGDITTIKYNMLHHRYDWESVEMAEMIEKNCPKVTYDSHVVIARKKHTKEKLRYMMPRKYTEDDYAFAGTYDGMDMYILYDGRKQLWDYAVGYDEDEIQSFIDRGFHVALIFKVKNYANTEYLEDIDRIVKKFDIEYLNIKEDAYKADPEDVIEENYKGLAKIINKNDMTLVVTENTDQLSNQKCLGYAHIFDETMKGSKKVIRAYETYDDSQVDESFYLYRCAQYFNSTIDRNIRFITVTQVAPKEISYLKCSENTLKATKLYKEKIEALGFRVNQETTPIDYTAEKTRNAAICAVIMVLCLLLMWQMITRIKLLLITLPALLIAGAAFAGTYILPDVLLSLYPTAFCVIMSCFAMTAVLYFVKTMKDRISLPLLLLGTLLLMLGILFAGAVCMGCMLSGIDYYINNEIFRGIKLSLMLPIFYTTILYYFLFLKKAKTGVLSDIKKVFSAEIKVYWLLIGGVIAAVGIYYIIRSGNVNKISGFEQAMRNAITEIFPARPRTKEFLIGYPALILFVYYVKNSKIALVQWLLAIAASILAASVTNSFCHVFTDFSVIVSRTLNGLLIGIGVSVFAYIANIILIQLLKTINRKLDQNTEMR
ncbi:MAG: hypothetical protein E7397_02120 [Ruminococcaceae bacterium]|nr:hypothetical protein [Oscillospiraceae bacterium]